jgi:hypothetical protein
MSNPYALGFGPGMAGFETNGAREKGLPDLPGSGIGGGPGTGPAAGVRGSAPGADVASGPAPKPPGQKTKSALGNFGRLSGIGQRKLKK